MTHSTILVTGAGGFLGRAISTSLATFGHRVVACVSPRTESNRAFGDRICRMHFPNPEFSRLVAQEKPDWLIHCAGSASVAASVQNPIRDWQANVAATASIYASIGRYSPETRIIFLSSAAVYGQPTTFPIDESTPLSPISPYGDHKRTCEGLGRELTEQVGVDVTNLRIFSAYGPGLEKQVLWDIYQKAIRSATVVLEGDGTETRDLIYVQDILSIIVRLVHTRPSAVKLLNVASGTSIDIASLAKQFLRTLGLQRELRFTGHRSPGVPYRWSVDTRALEQWNGPPKVTLNAGLSNYVDWLRYRTGEEDARRLLAAAG